MADALALLSLRRIVPDYAGACVRLRRSSDDAESDFAFGLDGLVDRAAIHAWLGGADPFVRRWHAQDGGSRHGEQATKPAQPKLVLAADDGLPEIVCDGDDDHMVTGEVDNPATTLHVLSVWNAKSVASPGGSDRLYDADTFDAAALILLSSGTFIRASTSGTSGGVATAYTPGTLAQTSALYQSVENHFRRDGELVGTYDPPDPLSVSYMTLGVRADLQVSTFANVAFREFLVYTEALAAGEEAAIEARQMRAWGVRDELPVIRKTSAGIVRTTADGRVLVTSRSEVPAPPAAPSGLSFDRATGTLTWSDQPDATHFDVYKAGGLHGELTEVASGLTTTSYAAGVLSAEEQAMYVVVARHARTGLSAASRPIALSNLRL